MTQTRLPIYIGYDQREHMAALVCAKTIAQATHYYRTDWRESGRMAVSEMLCHRHLRREGLFTRPWQVDEHGQFWDQRDGRPFSTEFSHSRFLVPHLAHLAGDTGWVGFVDCDFMFRRPAAALLDYCTPDKAIAVVKVDTSSLTAGLKMDGMRQEPYRRKLWSSLMLWNLDHEANRPLVESPEIANTWAGGSLHNFGWLGSEDLIGEIPAEWNYIPGISPEPAVGGPAAVHWSQGGPWMRGYEDVPFAASWRQEVRDLMDLYDRLDDFSSLNVRT